MTLASGTLLTAHAQAHVVRCGCCSDTAPYRHRGPCGQAERASCKHCVHSSHTGPHLGGIERLCVCRVRHGGERPGCFRDNRASPGHGWCPVLYRVQHGRHRAMFVALCAAPGPNGYALHGATGFSMMSTRPNDIAQDKRQRADWVCAYCQELNFARRQECYACGKLKQVQEGLEATDGARDR
eukprot:scaffold1186_cov399-Prasinococcus_capsulatus_cf.AAC.4